MKRVHLIEWGIITIGLIFGYKFFDTTFSLIVQIFVGFTASYSGMGEVLVPSLLMIALYFICFVMIVRKSHNIALYLSQERAGEEVPVKIGKRSLLQVILIGICFAMILSNLSDIIIFAYDYFKEESGRQSYTDDYETTGPGSIKSEIVELLVSVVVLYFSRDISNWFVKPDEVDELLVDTKPEN